MTNNDSLKPPLKWAGGKRWLLPILRGIWKDRLSERLVEPFAGGLAVSLGLQPKKAYLNDTNTHLINFYKQINKGLEIKKRFLNEEEYYYKRRDEFNNCISKKRIHTKQAAQLFYYLNRTGFNGLCRFNNSGFYNVPIGRYKKINYRKNFDEYKGVFKYWEFCNSDFAKMKIKNNDFLYLDPPYDSEFTKYCVKDFTWFDQERLVEWVSDFSGPIVASNQATTRVLDLYEKYGFNIVLLKAPRLISSNGNRKPAIEMLAWKNINVKIPVENYYLIEKQ